MHEPASVVVVGSLNLDLVAKVARLPARGETLLADGHSRALGGAGAVRVGSLSTRRHGALEAFPTAEEIGEPLTARSA